MPFSRSAADRIRRSAGSAQVAGPASARIAGLAYSTDARPGIARHRQGRGFVYRHHNGRPVSAADLRRIRALVIPPAWTDVWIAPGPRAHLQATGRDARGRKQYRYHPDWFKVRDSAKYDRLRQFGQALFQYLDADGSRKVIG
ncbi:MAG: DNA topoisomerase IB, partial [Acidobacteriota bacterium]